MLREVFSDAIAQRENYLTNIDARTKVLFVFGLIILSLCSNRYALPLLIAFLCLGFLLSIKISLKIIIPRLLAPLGVTAMVVVTQMLLYGSTPLVKLPFFGFNIIIYSEGLLRGLLILSRVIGAVSLIVFLSMTTSFNKLVSAARYFKLPYIWVEIALFTYRYIFVLFEDLTTVRDAQRVRLGYSKTLRSLFSLGELAGAAVIKAYDQSLAIQEAMILRGYKETAFYNENLCEKFTSKDYIIAAIFTTIFLLLVIINIYIK